MRSSWIGSEGLKREGWEEEEVRCEKGRGGMRRSSGDGCTLTQGQIVLAGEMLYASTGSEQREDRGDWGSKVEEEKGRIVTFFFI